MRSAAVEEIRSAFHSGPSGLGAELRGEIAEVRRHTGAMADDFCPDIRAVADDLALANERFFDRRPACRRQ
jgi:hypothetical protein